MMAAMVMETAMIRRMMIFIPEAEEEEEAVAQTTATPAATVAADGGTQSPPDDDGDDPGGRIQAPEWGEFHSPDTHKGFFQKVIRQFEVLAQTLQSTDQQLIRLTATQREAMKRAETENL